jgi:hypothetical protein
LVKKVNKLLTRRLAAYFDASRSRVRIVFNPTKP